MPKFKMRVLPYESFPKTRIVLTKSKALQQRMRVQPYLIGNSDSDYVCGNCDYLVARANRGYIGQPMIRRRRRGVGTPPDGPPETSPIL